MTIYAEIRGLRFFVPSKIETVRHSFLASLVCKLKGTCGLNSAGVCFKANALAVKTILSISRFPPSSTHTPTHTHTSTARGIFAFTLFDYEIKDAFLRCLNLFRPFQNVHYRGIQTEIETESLRDRGRDREREEGGGGEYVKKK